LARPVCVKFRTTFQVYEAFTHWCESLKCYQQMPDILTNMHQIQFLLGLCPRPCRESLQCSPRPPSWWEGLAAPHQNPSEMGQESGPYLLFNMHH